MKYWKIILSIPVIIVLIICINCRKKPTEPENKPPNVPSNPSPANEATRQPLDANLGWTGGDPDGDPVTYDVYFGTSSPPPLVSDDQSPTTFEPGSLQYNERYYWKIVTKDNHGLQAEGGIWEFSTGSYPPNIPSNPSPPDGATNQTLNVDLSWTGGDPDGDPVSYDIYFGTSISPPLISMSYPDTIYDLGTLNYNTKYYWKIVAKDSQDNITEGSVWEFTTIDSIGFYKRNVIIELFGYHDCPTFPPAKKAVDSLFGIYGDSLVVIEYHRRTPGDTLSPCTTFVNDRENLYNVSGYPTVVFDGVEKHVGGVGDLFSLYHNILEARFSDKSNLKVLSLNSYFIDHTTISYDLSIISNSEISGELFVVLTEDSVIFEDSLYNFVAKQVFPDENGMNFYIQKNDTFSCSGNISLFWSVVGDVWLNIFVQNLGTKAIYQSGSINLGPPPPSTTLKLKGRTTEKW